MKYLNDRYKQVVWLMYTLKCTTVQTHGEVRFCCLSLGILFSRSSLKAH